MTRLTINEPTQAQDAVRAVNARLRERAAVSSQAPCPVEYAGVFVRLCASQSCGKCTPCRVGLTHLDELIADVLDERANKDTIALIRSTAEGIAASADCAIGWEAARVVLEMLDGFGEDFTSHVEGHGCIEEIDPLPPCVRACPAGVDIPGYLALVAAGRNTDAVRLIRHDNPLPIACGLICEHPCEVDCRRGMVDNPISIRGVKRYATDHMECDYTPAHAEATGKKVAVIGGGPAGLTAAYYLALMGHTPVIYEQRKFLGGMMRYGIPSYRLPRERLQGEIDWILAQGVEARTEVSVGADVTFEDLRRDYDAVYVAVGAHSDNPLGIPGEDAEGVVSAVDMLRSIGDDELPDYTGKRIVVIGGGNVAMDVARSSVRLGASSVDIVYRRRKADMTAQVEEIEGAIAEGCTLWELFAPVEVVTEDGKVAGLKVQPQIIGEKVRGRFSPRAAEDDAQIIACDLIIAAIGQSIVAGPFEAAGAPVVRGRLVAGDDGAVEGLDGVFAGGDCVTGPATVIRAIAAGKVAAANIDEYLGFNHEIVKDVDIPAAGIGSHVSCARSDMVERPTAERIRDFELMEKGYSDQAALQEANRCLRCDHYGIGAVCGGRSLKW